jgi:hypothetical protein
LSWQAAESLKIESFNLKILFFQKIELFFLKSFIFYF